MSLATTPVPAPTADSRRTALLVGLWWLRCLASAVLLPILLSLSGAPWGGWCLGAVTGVGLALFCGRPHAFSWIGVQAGTLAVVIAWTMATFSQVPPVWEAWIPALALPTYLLWLVLTQQTLERSPLVEMSRLSASWQIAWALPLLAIGALLSRTEDLVAREFAQNWRWWPTALACLAVLWHFWMRHRLPLGPSSTGYERDAPTLSETSDSLSGFERLRFYWRKRSVRQAGLGMMALAALSILAGSSILATGLIVSTGNELVFLSAGLILGLWEAGRWSDRKVELGFVPWGAWLLLVTAGVRCWQGGGLPQEPAPWSMLILDLAVGFSLGLILTPLKAWLWWLEKQYPGCQAGSQTLGYALFAAGIAGVAGQTALQRGVAPEWLLGATLLGVAVGAVCAYRLVPALAIRSILWLLCRLLYRVRVYGQEHFPERGPVLIVPNHVSYADGVLVFNHSPRFARFLVYADYTEMWALRWLAKIMSAIPIRNTDGPKAILRALLTARESLKNGDVVGIFAEGQITKTGQLNRFQPGMIKILEGTQAVVVPTYIHGLWGSMFSFHGGRFFWKMPRQWRYPVSIHYGRPMPRPQEAREVQQAVALLGVTAMQESQADRLIPVRRFIRQCKRSRSREKVADSFGLKLTGGRLLAGSLALQRVLTRSVLQRDEQNIGLLLPPSVGTCVANMAVALAGRVSVNLNYTLTDDVINHCVRDAGLRHVLTSRRFLEKRPVQIEGAELIFLEDLKEQVSGLDKAVAALSAYVLPAGIVDRLHGLHALRPNDPCTIIFTSGSTGEPKGVVLSHDNIGTNVQAIDDLVHLRKDDCILGVLPFFHSFGYTATLWLTMCTDPKTVYHFNPLDSKIVGSLCQEHGVTIMLTTPTFLKSWMRRCTKEQFHRLDVVVLGAEKMPPDLAREFEEKFGVEPTEGYGTTELSPLASVNIPRSRALHPSERGAKMGTVGRVIPGCAARIVHPDTGDVLGVDQEGLLQIKGPNVMQGYLHHPEKTAEVIQDGWYNTGDMAKIDEDGFITITGRMSRFSKIGGEMVPHIRIEQMLAERLQPLPPGEGGDSPPQRIAVTAVPDARKGERLIVLHTPMQDSREELLKSLVEAGVPNLWVPSADSFLEVPEIPILGTGKLDLRRLKELALEAFGNQT